jgi:hypothetical protein
MKAKHPFTAEKLHFLSFEIQSAEIKSPYGFNPELVIKHDFKLNWDMGFDMEGMIIKADLGVAVTTNSEGEQEEEAHGAFQISAFYHLENLDEMVTYDGDEMKVDDVMASQIAAVTFSTSRGIIYTRFQGTVLRDFILPIVDPLEILGIKKANED